MAQSRSGVEKMTKAADIYLGIWCIYVTFMTIGAWFGPDVNSFEDWMFSVMAWMLLIVAGFAVRGNN